VRWKPQHRRILTVGPATSATFRASSGLSNFLVRISRASCESLYAINSSHRKQETFLYEHPLPWVLLPTKANNITLLLGGIHLKHVRHFDCWNQPLNMRIRVCYLDCHEAGLCCYLVIHIESHLRPLQLFSSIWDLFTGSPSYTLIRMRRNRLSSVFGTVLHSSSTLSVSENLSKVKIS
jgi:hypothetical protein